MTKSRYVSWYVGKIAAQKVRNNGAACNAGSQSDSVEVVTGCPFKNRTAREAERLENKTVWPKMSSCSFKAVTWTSRVVTCGFSQKCRCYVCGQSGATLTLNCFNSRMRLKILQACLSLPRKAERQSEEMWMLLKRAPDVLCCNNHYVNTEWGGQQDF